MDNLLAVSGLKRGKHKGVRQRKVPSAVVSHAKPSCLAARPPAYPRTGDPSILQVPEWKRYPWLLHGFSTRLGGVSTVYKPDAQDGDLNLGLTAADSHKNVVKNRQIFLDAVQAEANRIVKRARATRNQPYRPHSLRLLRQIHSGCVHRFSPDQAHRLDAHGKPTLRGDGAIANDPGVMLGIQTADCIPVLVADVQQRVVAAFHAGWRGTLARVVERGVGRMRAEFGCRPEDLTAAIGPGIGPCCYSVGEEVRSEFRSQFCYADELFQEVFDLDPIKEKYPMLFLTARAPGHSNLGPNLHLDLIEANRRQLLDAGVLPNAIHALGLCTACDTAHFFSHRAEQGFTGRMLNVIGIAK